MKIKAAHNHSDFSIQNDFIIAVVTLAALTRKLAELTKEWNSLQEY